jgi:hypothetical protein
MLDGAGKAMRARENEQIVMGGQKADDIFGAIGLRGAKVKNNLGNGCFDECNRFQVCGRKALGEMTRNVGDMKDT